MRSDFPRSRRERRELAINLVETRTTRSPRATRNRSSAPETCRQSSSAQARSLPRPRAHSTSAPTREPRRRSSSQRAPGPSPRRPPRSCANACGCPPRARSSAPSPSTWLKADIRRTGLASGAATLLSSHAEHPRPATSDTTKASHATPADSLKESQLAARSGPSPRCRRSPTPRIKTASLKAVAAPSDGGGPVPRRFLL
jgi:hypothetical protein